MKARGAESLKAMAEKRQQICRNVPPCPECATRQVQLVNVSDDFPLWKCRHCGNKWNGKTAQESNQ